MIKNSYIISKDLKLEQIIDRMYLNKCRGLVVLDKKKILGIITDGEIFKSWYYKKNMSVTAQNIMNKSFKFVENKNRDQVKKIFSEQTCTFIPVVNKKMELVDIINLDDFFLKKRRKTTWLRKRKIIITIKKREKNVFTAKVSC